MTDNSELHRLMRLRRLGREIAATCRPISIASRRFRCTGVLRELPAGAPRRMSKPTSNKAALRAQLEAALANYHGPVTVCPPAAPPEPDRDHELDLADNDEVDKDAVIGR